MPRRYRVKELTFHENCLLATVSDSLSDHQAIVATGRLLVDSDRLTFVYIIDSVDGYFYIEFPKMVWPILYEGLQNNASVIVVEEGQKMLELEHFNDELIFLIDNIANNPNYGSKLVSEVEAIFQSN